MSVENEDVSSGYEACDISSVLEKEAKILYSREFLLSFGELDICKKLPSGFDPSILSEFEDAFHKEQERQRAPVGSQWQGYKRNEYSSSPPTQGDSGTYSRNTYGRWDTRSFGRSERDSDTQSDKDSDPGRHHVNPSRRPWQSSDHDGVLGSGSFPRPGYGSGNSLQKGRVTDDYQLNRNNGPYPPPPRPYKAAPLFVRETKDSFNDETFGSSEGASEDKVEEERQRRASFELMRMEQHKVLQGKQKVKADAGISEILEDMKKEKSDLGGSDVLHESATAATPVNDFVKSSILSQTTTSRPLVPPGFANAIGEKNSGMKPSIHAHKVEIAKFKPKELPLNYGPLDSLERQSSQDHSDHRLEGRSTHTILLDKGTKMDSPYSFEVSEKLHMGDKLFRTSNLSETHDSFDNHEVIPKVSGSKAQGDFNKSQTNIVLENIFGSILPIDATSSISPAEQPDGKPENTWTPSSVQSSKFAQWFLEEERKPAEDLTYGRPNDLLSLIAGGDEGVNRPSDEKYMGNFPSENSHNSSVFVSELMSGLSSKSNDISIHQCESSKTKAIPSVLTCEDLEQTILLECSDKIQNLPLTEQSIQCSSVSDAKSEQLRPVDNHASQHLLSLLHKDAGLNKIQVRTDMEIRLNDVSPSDECNMQAALGETSGEGLKGDPGSSTSTLEALFGSAFMRELQSAEAPVSVQRGSVESAQTDVSEDLGLPFPLMNGGSTHIVNNEVGQKSTSQRGNNLPLNHRQKSRSESWLEISDSQDQPDSRKSLIGLNSRHSGILEVDRYQLPKEERLITSNDPLNHPNLMVRPAAPLLQSQLSSNAPINRIGPEIPHHNLYARPPSLQFQNPMMSQERPSPFPLDSHPAHMNPHMKFLGPESMIHYDPSASHQLPENMARPHFPHPSAGVTGVNITSHNPISQQMQTSGNHPQQLLHRFQNTGFPHPGNQPNALIPELNPMQGFPFSPHHPPNMSISGPPIPAPTINNGSNHPEAFQMLLEMERRAKSKQIHPPPPGHNQAMYNDELNRGFRYK